MVERGGAAKPLNQVPAVLYRLTAVMRTVVQTVAIAHRGARYGQQVGWWTSRPTSSVRIPTATVTIRIELHVPTIHHAEQNMHVATCAW